MRADPKSCIGLLLVLAAPRFATRTFNPRWGEANWRRRCRCRRTDDYGTYTHAARLQSEHHAFVLKLLLPRSEHSMNIFYIIGVIVVVVVVAGFFGLHV
jgi:hypothetical protein